MLWGGVYADYSCGGKCPNLRPYSGIVSWYGRGIRTLQLMLFDCILSCWKVGMVGDALSFYAFHAV